MRYFQTQVSIESLGWQAGMPDDFFQVKKTSLTGPKLNEFWGVEEPIQLHLWRSDRDRAYENEELFDAYEWFGDSMHIPIMRGKPSSYSMLVSEKFSLLLSRFRLPEFKFYPATLFNEENQTKRNFRVFHVLNMAYKELIYERVTFSLISKGVIRKTYNEGEIPSFEKFLMEQKNQQAQDRRCQLVPNKYVYREDFDVLTLPNGGFYFSERLRDEIFSKSITGLSFVESTNIIHILKDN